MPIKVEFPSVTTTMSILKLGSAGTEYGCEARELAEANLYTEDSYVASFAQEDL